MRDFRAEVVMTQPSEGIIHIVNQKFLAAEPQHRFILVEFNPQFHNGVGCEYNNFNSISDFNIMDLHFVIAE